jgi:hypothetical protein
MTNKDNGDGGASVQVAPPSPPASASTSNGDNTPKRTNGEARCDATAEATSGVSVSNGASTARGRTNGATYPRLTLTRFSSDRGDIGKTIYLDPANKL